MQLACENGQQYVKTSSGEYYSENITMEPP